MTKSFQIKVLEIPNQFIKRQNYSQNYEIVAKSATDAKQEALDRFGDYSRIEYCKEFSADTPPEYNFDNSDE